MGHWQVGSCSLYGLYESAAVVLVYWNDVGCLCLLVNSWIGITRLGFDLALGGFVISWESYLGSSINVKIKCMTLTSAAKGSLCCLVLVMILCDRRVFDFGVR